MLLRLLTTIIDGEDHRGPGFIPSGTLLERLFYVGDVLNEDKESGETAVAMVGRYVKETCGEEELKRQIEQANEVMDEENTRKTALEKEDKEALNKIWNILKKADKKDLESNAELKTALMEFEDQLRKPGNEKIIQEAEKLFDRDYVEFGSYDSSKNNFAKNQIIGKAQLRRLSACDLQICFSGLYESLKGPRVIAKRIDVRRDLGVSGGAVAYLLGSNCHLDVLACVVALRVLGAQRGPRESENLCRAKTSRFKKLCSDWTIHQTASLRL